MLHDAQRSSICEGREFIAGQARYKCPIENIKLKLTTKSQIINVSPNRCCCLHIAHVTLSRPTFANTFVSGCLFRSLLQEIIVQKYLEINFSFSLEPSFHLRQVNKLSMQAKQHFSSCQVQVHTLVDQAVCGV